MAPATPRRLVRGLSFVLVGLVVLAGCGDQTGMLAGADGESRFRDRSLGGVSDVEDEITAPLATPAEAEVEAGPLPAPADPDDLEAAAGAETLVTDPEERVREPTTAPTPAPPAARPAAEGTLNRLCFSPKEDCLNLLLSYLQAETEGIDIAIYHLYDSRMSEILIRKHRAGVPVRVLADRHAYTVKGSHRREMNRLAASGVPVRTNRFRGIIHHKTTILHGLGLVEQGSMNYTSIASRKVVGTNGRTEWNEELAFFTTNRRVLARYRERFDRAWANTGGGRKAYLVFRPDMALPTFDEAEARKPVTCYEDPSPAPKPLRDDPLLSVCFGGDQQCNKDVVGPLVADEDRRLDVIAFRLTVGSVTGPILERARAGVRVRLIFERSQYAHPSYPSMTTFLDELHEIGRTTGDVAIKATAHQGFMHMKSIITSKAAIWGSANYTSSSSRHVRGCQNLYYQTEDMVVARDGSLVGRMRARFDEMWASRDFADWEPPRVASE
ncbi:MAG TPA: phospholipase D-like domain-containing protein [Thermodesulfobacteriota bacterium]